MNGIHRQVVEDARGSGGGIRMKPQVFDPAITKVDSPSEGGGMTTAVGERIDEALNTKRLDELVEAYFDRDGPFAAASFDILEPGPPNKITSADLFAVSFLDVSIQPLAARGILGKDAAAITSRLDRVPTETPLWDATDDHLQAATELWEYLRRSYAGIDWVTAGKLLARKRPALVPVVDSVIANALQSDDETWSALRTALQDGHRRQHIEDLRPDTAPTPVTTLRLLDVVLWMLGSRGRHARVARSRIGL